MATKRKFESDSEEFEYLVKTAKHRFMPSSNHVSIEALRFFKHDNHVCRIHNDVLWEEVIPDNEGWFEEQLDREDFRERFQAALVNYSERDQAIIAGCLLGHKTQATMAEELGVTQEAVQSKLKTIRKRLARNEALKALWLELDGGKH